MAAEMGLAQRFVLRFRSLEQFRLPHLPSYHDFEQSSGAAQSPLESRVVLDAAHSSFAEAGQLLEKVSSVRERSQEDRDSASDLCFADAKDLKRVVVANQLAVMKLTRALEAGQILKKTFRVSASPSHHPYLMSLQVLDAT